MIRFIKQEIEIEEALKQRIMIICDFCNTTPTIENGSIRRIDKTNLTYVEPHRITIKDKLYLVFNFSLDAKSNDSKNIDDDFEL